MACAPAPPQSSASVAADEITTQPDIQQKRLCEVDGWQHDIAKRTCTPGQKIVFLPSRWGNEQLPILFAAVNCDMRYSVALTNGGVACIYAPIDVAPAGPSPPSSERPETAEEK